MARGSPDRTWKLPTAVANATTGLVNVIAQYPILEVLVSYLQPDDLVNVSRLAQLSHSLIWMHDGNVKANLLAKTLCPGLGLHLSTMLHCPCTTRGFSTNIGCAALPEFHVESQPCHECGVNTCNETHVFYHVLTEDPGLDNHRWWAGYLFLKRQAIATYPAKNEEDSDWYLPADPIAPLHDRGRLHIPLQIAGVADPEPIDCTLDINLGCHRITPRGRTALPFSGQQVVGYLNYIAESRKERLCRDCFHEHRKRELPPCSCTLRNRFLDRWLCLPCYLKERESDKAIVDRDEVEPHGDHQHLLSHTCDCGTSLSLNTDWDVICNWCKGAVREDLVVDSDGPDNTDETASFDGDEHDEDHSSADFNGLPAYAFAFAENCDGSVSVYGNGHRVCGKRLSRALVVAWLAKQGVKPGCTCCHCDGHGHHHHGSGSDEDMDGDEDDDDDVDDNEDGDGDENVDGEDVPALHDAEEDPHSECEDELTIRV